MVVSTSTINPLGVFMQATGKRVLKVQPSDLFEEKTGLAKDTTNTLIDESAGADQVLLVHGYEIQSSRPLNIRIRANNEDRYTSTDYAHEFGEAILIEPQKSIEVTESHTNYTIPIKIRMRTTKVWLTSS